MLNCSLVWWFVLLHYLLSCGIEETSSLWFCVLLFQHNEAIHRLYDSLQERIGSQQDVPHFPANMDHFDSPLMSVPTPAPL